MFDFFKKNNSREEVETTAPINAEEPVPIMRCGTPDANLNLYRYMQANKGKVAISCPNPRCLMYSDGSTGKCPFCNTEYPDYYKEALKEILPKE